MFDLVRGGIGLIVLGVVLFIVNAFVAVAVLSTIAGICVALGFVLLVVALLLHFFGGPRRRGPVA